jgi:large subunit ribosomal protein L25
MGEKVTLSAEARAETNGKAAKLRESGFVPAVIYGQGFENLPIKIKAGELKKVYEKAGESTLVELRIGNDAPVNVLIYDIALDPIKGKIMHADFYRVNMKESIETEIPLEFIGEAQAVKDLGGTLVKMMDTVEVECLPGDLVGSIEVDISCLATFDDIIKISDIKFPQGVKPLAEPDASICLVQEPREEEAEQAPAEQAPQEQAEADKSAKEEKKG